MSSARVTTRLTARRAVDSTPVQRIAYISNGPKIIVWHFLAINKEIWTFDATGNLSLAEINTSAYGDVKTRDLHLTLHYISVDDPQADKYAMLKLKYLAACDNTIEIQKKNDGIFKRKKTMFAKTSMNVVGNLTAPVARAMLWAGVMLDPTQRYVHTPNNWVQPVKSGSSYDNLCNVWHKHKHVDDEEDTDDDADDDTVLVDDEGDDLLQISEVRTAPFVPDLLKSSIALCSSPTTTPAHKSFLNTFATIPSRATEIKEITFKTESDELVYHHNAYHAYQQMQHLPVQVASLASALGTSVHMQLGFLLEKQLPKHMQTSEDVEAGVSSILAPLAAAVAQKAYDVLNHTQIARDRKLVSNELCAAIPFLTQGETMFGAFPDATLFHSQGYSAVELKTRWKYTQTKLDTFFTSDNVDIQDKTSLNQNKVQTLTQAVSTGMMHNATCDAQLIVAYIPKIPRVQKVGLAVSYPGNSDNLNIAYAGLLTRCNQFNVNGKGAKTKYADAYTDDYLHIHTDSLAIIGLIYALLNPKTENCMFALVSSAGIVTINPYILKTQTAPHLTPWQPYNQDDAVEDSSTDAVGDDDDEVGYIVDTILGYKQTKGGVAKWEVLWGGGTKTWEPRKSFGEGQQTTQAFTDFTTKGHNVFYKTLAVVTAHPVTNGTFKLFPLSMNATLEAGQTLTFKVCYVHAPSVKKKSIEQYVTVKLNERLPNLIVATVTWQPTESMLVIVLKFDSPKVHQLKDVCSRLQLTITPLPGRPASKQILHLQKKIMTAPEKCIHEYGKLPIKRELVCVAHSKKTDGGYSLVSSAVAILKEYQVKLKGEYDTLVTESRDRPDLLYIPELLKTKK